MKRRNFILGMLGLATGLVLPGIWKEKKAEAAITILRGSREESYDSTNQTVYERPVHPSAYIKDNPDSVPEMNGYYTDSYNTLGVDIVETYLKFGPLENRTRTNAIVIHHIGNTNSDVSASTVHSWHLNQGWAGIGYHFLIRKDGTIERGRPQDAVGAHCYAENDHTIGVNIVGNFEKYTPTDAQMHSAARLLAALCSYYRLKPSRRTIIGHRDLNRTACPGANMYYRMDELVQLVKGGYNGNFS